MMKNKVIKLLTETEGKRNETLHFVKNTVATTLVLDEQTTSRIMRLIRETVRLND